MKTLSMILISALLAQAAFAAKPQRVGDANGAIVQGPMSVGTSSAPNSKTVLDVVSTTKAARPCPPMTQAQRDAISSPANGSCVFNTDTSKFNQYSTSAGSWSVMAGGGGSGGENLLTNGDFESGTGSWTAGSGVTAAAESTEIHQGQKSVKLTLSSVNGDVFYQYVTPTQKIGSNAIEDSIWVKTSLSTVQVCSVLNASEQQCVAVPSDNVWHQVLATHIGSNAVAQGVKVKTTSSTSGDLYVDDGYTGTNRAWAQVSQSSIWGGVEWTAGDNTWQITQTTYAALFSANGTNATAFGNAAAPGTATPAVVANNLSPADYKITFANFAIQSPSGVAAKCQIGDGSGRLAEIVSQRTSSGDTHPLTMTARVTYSTLTSKTYSLACLSASGAVTVQSTTASYAIIERFPTSTDGSVRGDQSAASYSGTLVGAGGGWANTSSGSFGAFSVATTSSTLTQLTSRNLTCVAESTKLPAITCTLPKSGTYRVSTSGTASNSSAGAGWGIRIADGSGTAISGGGVGLSTSAGANTSFSQQGLYAAAAQGSVTFQLQGTNFGTGTVSIAEAALEPITWTVEQADGTLPQFLIPGSVFSGSAGTERTERARIAQFSGTPVITSQSGSWITGVVDNSAGNTTLNISSGTFSAAPTCTASEEASSNNDLVVVSSVSTSAVTVRIVDRASGSATDRDWSIICMGPH